MFKIDTFVIEIFRKKILYNRDITNFNPRSFDKTELLQEQIQHNWCSVRKWWFDVLNAGGLTGKSIRGGFCDLSDIPESEKLNLSSNSLENSLAIPIASAKRCGCPRHFEVDPYPFHKISF